MCGANFPHFQPMAELQRNQRGEIRCQHVQAHSCSHFSPCFDHTSPTQTNDGTSQIDYNISAYVPHSFQTMSSVILCPCPTGVHGWRRQGQRLNVTAQWRDHLKWERDFTASMISAVFFKTSVDGQPPTQQTGSLATQLTRWRLCIAVVSGMVSPKRLNYKNYKTALLE